MKKFKLYIEDQSLAEAYINGTILLNEVRIWEKIKKFLKYWLYDEVSPKEYNERYNALNPDNSEHNDPDSSYEGYDKKNLTPSYSMKFNEFKNAIKNSDPDKSKNIGFWSLLEYIKKQSHINFNNVVPEPGVTDATYDSSKEGFKYIAWVYKHKTKVFSRVALAIISYNLNINNELDSIDKSIRGNVDLSGFYYVKMFEVENMFLNHIDDTINHCFNIIKTLAQKESSTAKGILLYLENENDIKPYTDYGFNILKKNSNNTYLYKTF